MPRSNQRAREGFGPPHFPPQPDSCEIVNGGGSMDLTWFETIILLAAYILLMVKLDDWL